MSRFELTCLLFATSSKDGAPLVTLNGETGILEAVEREDGSGHCFNIRVNMHGTRKTFFIRTID